MWGDERFLGEPNDFPTSIGYFLILLTISKVFWKRGRAPVPGDRHPRPQGTVPYVPLLSTIQIRSKNVRIMFLCCFMLPHVLGNVSQACPLEGATSPKKGIGCVPLFSLGCLSGPRRTNAQICRPYSSVMLPCSENCLHRAVLRSVSSNDRRMASAVSLKRGDRNVPDT